MSFREFSATAIECGGMTFLIDDRLIVSEPQARQITSFALEGAGQALRNPSYASKPPRAQIIIELAASPDLAGVRLEPDLFPPRAVVCLSRHVLTDPQSGVFPHYCGQVAVAAVLVGVASGYENPNPNLGIKGLMAQAGEISSQLALQNLQLPPAATAGASPNPSGGPNLRLIK